jgi:4a-hydroxytetrahydrobiopterin dehydratase
LGNGEQTYRRRQKERLRPEEELAAIMPALTTKQVSLHLRTVPRWSKRAQTILRTFKFEGFLKAIDFVNRIARKAQKINHHPDIDIRFDKVTLKLTTHDEGGITEKDFSLARQCDEVFDKWSGS